MALEKSLRDLSVGPAATVADVKNALRLIETEWPKVVRFKQTPMMAAIKHALAMFEQSHPNSQYVTALQA